MKIRKEIALVVCAQLLVFVLFIVAATFVMKSVSEQIEKDGGLSGVAAKALDSVEQFKEDVEAKREK